MSRAYQKVTKTSKTHRKSTGTRNGNARRIAYKKNGNAKRSAVRV